MYLEGRATLSLGCRVVLAKRQREREETSNSLERHILPERKVGQGFRGFSHLRAVASANGWGKW